MGILKLIQTYSRKSSNKNRVLLIFCLITIMFSVSAILSIQLITDFYKDSIDKQIKHVNEGNLNIFSEDKFLSKRNVKFLEELKSQGTINYELQFKKTVNIYTEEIIETCLLNIKNSDKTKASDSKTNIHLIKISKVLAEHLKAGVGDQVKINFKGQVLACEIGEVIDTKKGISLAENEMELTGDILGVVFLDEFPLPLEDNKNIEFNGATIDLIDRQDLESLKESLEKNLGKDFIVRSEEDLFNKVKNRITLQTQILNFIGIAALITCGVSVFLTFSVINRKREKDFAIFKALGMKKRQIVLLTIIEALFMGIFVCFTGIPLGLIIFKYLSIKFLGTVPLINSGILLIILKIIGIILLAMISFSLIPMDIVTSVPMTTIFRDKTTSVFEKIKIFRSVIFLLILISLLTVIYTGTIFGIPLLFLFFIIMGIFFGVIRLSYLLVSQLRRVMKNKYYFTFIGIKSGRNKIALSSLTYIIALTLILLVSNILFNFSTTYNNGLNNKTRKDEMVMNVDIGQWDKVEQILKKEKITNILRLEMRKSSILNINGENIEDIIVNRFPTSLILREDYEDSCSNIKVVSVFNSGKLPKILISDEKQLENLGEDEVIISTNFFKMLHEFKEGDSIILNINGLPKPFQVKAVDKGMLAQDLGAFAILNINLRIGEGLPEESYFIYLMNEKGQELPICRKILEKVPEVYVYNNNASNEYIVDFINEYQGVFVYSTFLCVISGLLFLLSNNYISMINARKNMAIFYAFGADRKDIIKIFILQGLIIVFLNSLIAIGLSHGLSKFFVEVMMQKDYISNIILNGTILAVSVVINILLYIFVLKNNKEESFYAQLRSND